MSKDIIDEDFKKSRDTYDELLVIGKTSLETLVRVAEETEHPRAFEVLATMIKNLSDINDKVMDLHQKNKEIKKEDKKQLESPDKVTNVFIGSAVELQKLIAEQNQTIDITPNDDNE